MDRDTAPPCRGDQLGEHVSISRQRTRTRLEARIPIERRLRPETRDASFQEANLATGIVREDIARLVVHGREGDSSEPASTLDVVENGLGALVGEICGKGEDRGLHGVRE